jgi:DNA-binding NarL/FixJ family response regulator
MTARVLLADDDGAFCHALATVLVSSGHADVVGTASNGEEAVELYRRLAPDVVLMDVVMPVCDGVEATRQIVAFDAGARIVAMTSGDDDQTLAMCLAVGAKGWLKKSAAAMALAPMLLALAARQHSDDVVAETPPA